MIHVENLTYTYQGTTTPAIRGLTFSIEAGEVFGFLGPSGAGKSTTQNILIGLLRDYEGRITVMGRDLAAWGPDYYERIGVSFERPNHYLRLTALENLRYFAALYEDETEDPTTLLEMVGLADDADKHVSQFSKGMQVRLTVARSLLHRPDIIFMDEPTSGLDPVNARRMMEIIERLRAEDRTVFLTTHNMAVADRLCDRVAFIVEGEIALIDAPRDLKLAHGRRQVRVEYRDGDGLAARDFPLDGIGQEAAFIELLREADIETIHTQETTLENVFIEVTGRRLT